MIIADTNVLSEPLRPAPDRRVLEWLSANRHLVGLTSITIGELFYGAERLPAGARRTRLLGAIGQLVDEAGERILVYGDAEARVYASLRAQREANGRPISTEDAMIAAICLATGSDLATRNVKDFEGTGVTVLDPWQVA